MKGGYILPEIKKDTAAILTDKNIGKEFRKIKKMFAGIEDESKKELVFKIIEEVAFQKVAMKAARQEMIENGLQTETKNASQKFIKENPAVATYDRYAPFLYVEHETVDRTFTAEGKKDCFKACRTSGRRLNQWQQYKLYCAILRRDPVRPDPGGKVYQKDIPDFNGRDRGRDVYLQPQKARKAIKFIENFCHHSEGRNDLLKLELWQKAAVSAIFGIMDPEKPTRRMFREVFLLVARKNGKTLFAAAITAYMAYIDGEYGAKLYHLAPKLDQADLCYEAFYQITQSDDELKEITKKRRSDIYIKDFNTSIKKIAFNSKKSDGFNPHFVLNDEMEAWPGDQGLKQYEVMTSAIGSRKQPIIMSTSTAGYINDGIFDELMRRSTAFLKGRSQERRILPFLYIIDDVEKWDTREELEKSNPNLDVSVFWDYYREKIAIARASLSAKAEFLTKFCNIKQNSSIAWLEFTDVEKALTLDEDGFPVQISLEDFRGAYCVGGIDLSRTTDLTAASIIIEKAGKKYIFTKFYMPEERYKVAINEENVPYNVYVEKGFLQLSGKHAVNYKDVYKWFFDLVKVYK